MQFSSFCPGCLFALILFLFLLPFSKANVYFSFFLLAIPRSPSIVVFFLFTLFSRSYIRPQTLVFVSYMKYLPRPRVVSHPNFSLSFLDSIVFAVPLISGFLQSLRVVVKLKVSGHIAECCLSCFVNGVLVNSLLCLPIFMLLFSWLMPFFPCLCSLSDLN